MQEQAQIGGPSGEERGNPQGCGFHELSQLFPLLDGPALNELAEDIRKHGLREPIVLFEGSILDGRNRYLACQRAGIEPHYRDLDEGIDPISYVVSANLHRRHLSESQRAIAAAKLAKLAHGQRQTGQLAALPTQAEAAAIFKVGERSVRRAAQVRDKGSAELVSAVEQGKVSVNRAADIAHKPIERQAREIANPAAAKPRGRRKPAKAGASELNPISWEDAPREARARFVDAVGGLEPFWEVAHRDVRDRFIEHHRREWEQRATPSNLQQQIDPSKQTDSLEMPEFLDRTSSKAVAPAAHANATNLEQGSDAS